MSSPSPSGMRGGAKKRKSGRIEVRADWSEDRTYFLVSILKEYNSPRHRAQNGWTKEAWNSMTQRVNAKFASANYVVSQVKDREQRLKKDYGNVKTILSKSGFGWDNDLKMATTIDGLWTDLPKKLQKWKNKSFPYYDDLHDIYNGKIAEGKHCRRSSEKNSKTENKFVEEDYGQMRTPSPTIPAIRENGSFIDLVQGGIDLNTENGFDFEMEDSQLQDSQYRAMAAHIADREAQHYSHTEPEISHMQEMPKRKDAAGACAGTEREKKKSRGNDNAMNELIALRKEELEAYKELIEKQLELKRKQIPKELVGAGGSKCKLMKPCNRWDILEDILEEDILAP